MKTLLLTKDNRVIVKETIENNGNRFRYQHNKKAPTIVYCPCCGATIPYSDICKQFTYKTKYNRKTLLEIIRSEDVLTTGILAKHYQDKTNQQISIRMLSYILRDFQEKFWIKTQVTSSGRYGRTTKIFSVNSNRRVIFK